jgi:hypothetical protein
MPSDWKAPPRIRDPEALRRFRLAHIGEPCEVCGIEPGVDPHHERFRSQGGGDVEPNLRWLGRNCHRALHGNPYVDANGRRWDATAVRAALSEDGP